MEFSVLKQVIESVIFKTLTSIFIFNYKHNTNDKKIVKFKDVS